MTNTMKIPRARFARAFTLIEVLAVLGILTLLVAGAAPVILSTVKASRITQAAGLVQARLHEAKTLALTFSNDFEVRLLAASKDDPDPRDAIQILALNDAEAAGDGTALFQPAGAPEFLPAGVVFSRNDSFSTLLKRGSSAPDAKSPEEASALAVIRFFSDGSTSLSESGVWHVTVVDSADERTAALPINFATIQIDPVTGSLSVFRPE